MLFGKFWERRSLMGILPGSKRTQPASAVGLLQQISKRAEDLTPEEQAKSFVTIRRIDGALKNRDSRILFGRRGTGKTHILSYVASSARSSGDIACVIDLRTLGSNNSIYSDQNIDPSVRATRLIRDLITAIHDQLLDYYTEPTSRFRTKGLDQSIERLSACVKTIVVSEWQESREKSRITNSTSSGVGIGAGVSTAGAKFESSGKLNNEKKNDNELELSTSGTPRLSINMGDAAKVLSDISSGFEKRVWLLLDEWSSLPEILQPYLADFIRRAVLPVQNITVQIAAIEFRSKFRINFEDFRVGLELGSDISADINLDDYFVYDVSPNSSIEFFQQLLYRHLMAFAGENGLIENSPEEVLSSVFSQDRVFSELVRAAEGVPRDFINILQMAAMRSDQTKISMNEIRTAAKDWFERDKQRNLDTNPRAQTLLDWIRDKVIEGKKARAFLLSVDESDSAIEFLFDERMLHIARRSYSAKDQPGVRYRVWKVDYGCYVDLINTVKNPTGFLFAGSEATDAGDIEVPEDDYRAVRRAILDIEDFDKNMTA